MKEIVELLKEKEKTISTMESCTGGYIVNEITNIEGSSEVIKFSAITYSNEYKIKMGVPKEIIDHYTVYSRETSEAMSLAISNYTNSDYGVGITGKLNKVDKENPYGPDNIVYVSIYDKKNNHYTTTIVEATSSSRRENKEKVKEVIVKLLKQIIEEE